MISKKRRIWKNFFLLSIACHLLFFLTVIGIRLPWFNGYPKKPQIELPAYIYQGQKAVFTQSPSLAKLNQQQVIEKKENPQRDSSRDGIEKKVPKPAKKEVTNMAQTFAPIEPLLNAAKLKTMMHAEKDQDPVHMLGEKMIDNPLQKLIGIALTKHLTYPELAERLGIHGVVSISIVLNPDGRIEQIQLLKSSKQKMLDVAALDAIRESSPIRDVDIYLLKPRHLVINIIFN